MNFFLQNLYFRKKLLYIYTYKSKYIYTHTYIKTLLNYNRKIDGVLQKGNGISQKYNVILF